MHIFRAHWYDLGLIPAALALGFLALRWGDLSVLRRLALLNFVVIFWHQFEEYRFPGGEPAILNLAVQPSPEGPSDRYPLNRNNAMLINVAAAYGVYLLPVLFPTVLWLGFMPVLFGISQAVMHCVLTPKKLGNRIYSPGALAVVFGHIPVGGYWLYYTIANGLLAWPHVLGGVVYMALFIGLFMRKLSYGVLSRPDSPYPFSQAEMDRGGYTARIRAQNSHPA